MHVARAASGPAYPSNTPNSACAALPKKGVIATLASSMRSWALAPELPFALLLKVGFFLPLRSLAALTSSDMP